LRGSGDKRGDKGGGDAALPEKLRALHALVCEHHRLPARGLRAQLARCPLHAKGEATFSSGALRKPPLGLSA